MSPVRMFVMTASTKDNLPTEPSLERRLPEPFGSNRSIHVREFCECVVDFQMISIIVREQQSTFTTLTLLLLAKGIDFMGTTWESFGRALSMAVEHSGSATMLTVTSPDWATMTGMSSKKRFTMLMENFMVTAHCSTTTGRLGSVTGKPLSYQSTYWHCGVAMHTYEKSDIST